MFRLIQVLMACALLLGCATPAQRSLINVKVLAPLARESSGTVTLANGSSTTISHGALTTVPVIGAVSIQTALDGTLVANWTSNVNADSGQTATANNGAAISGGWLELDGTNDYLTYADDAAFSPGSSPWTVEIDVQFDTTSGQAHVINHAGPGELYAWAIVRNGTTLLCHAGANNNRDILNDVTLGTVGTGTTYQVALVFTGTHYYGYLNGTRVFDVTSSSTVLNAAGPITVGRPSSVSTEYWDGRGRRLRLTVGTALYTGSTYTPPSADYTGTQTKTHLRIGTDYSATTNATGTTITNISGSSKDISASLYY